MMLLALRFLLAPALVAAASLASRKWGESVGGWLAAFPFVAGPLLLVMTLEHGTRFGASSALSALSGITALAVFAVCYAHLARRIHWSLALPIGWSLYLGSAALMRPLEHGLVASLLGAFSSLWLATALLPRNPPTTDSDEPRQPPWWDLLARMASAAALVGSVATLSERLGPSWSGLLTPFPISTTILVAFAHAQDGHPAVARMLTGFLPALSGLTLFFATLSVVLVPLGPWAGFSLALAVAVATQALLLWRRSRA
ncbi:MAG TPA: hypothetical protein PK208_04335 [Fibrobacteria bacterium]|nr:hypothetical protein [Fibrobacteria bacterium]